MRLHALRHNALVYESESDYLALAVPFLWEGLAAGEGAIVAHTKPGLAMTREALGGDAAEVMFVDVSSAYTRPAQTLAGYHRAFAQQLAHTPTLRAVADVQFGTDPGEWDLWACYEAVFNRSFDHLPAWVLCSYNANGAPDQIIEAIWQTHPEVVDGTTWSTSETYTEPEDLLRRLAPVAETLAGLRTIPFGRDIGEFREQLARELDAEKVPEARRLDMLLAATEVATNAEEHGGGGRTSAWAARADVSCAKSSIEARGSTTRRRATWRRGQESAEASGWRVS
jgi:MEDS: MEthanogen/methylotroph, DcmR Sensory domain